MADFRQLALEFVLADEEPKQTSLAKQAATELESAPANSNPVARWVEAVQPWMPGSSGDEAMVDSDETPNWTGRAKALEFLSRTLDFVGKDVLKPSQVKLLISFFSAMFDVDHKAGVMPSATALSRIAQMKAFQPTSADDIISKICALKDDFPRQIAKTRLEVFELLRSLITNPTAANDLQYKHGASSGFMTELLQLCKNERDPNCLMVWFDILAYFLREYSPSKEVIEEVYNTFKAYFPITLPRASTSGLTPEELKLQLRKCFIANSTLAEWTFPFLIGKLDQGEGVTVNVKVDVLKTIKECLEEYGQPEQSVVPYVESIWGSLKYEVRNGEIEDTIWATLEVLKTIGRKLKGDNLRDYCLTVTRDCVNDLSNVIYAGPAGRLLVGVLSASASAFVLMVSPAITHIKDNLRHPKAPNHSQDLHKLLHIVIESRILLANADMTSQERDDFAATDPIFQNLWKDVYKKVVEPAWEYTSQDDLKLATQAVQGAGALVCLLAALPGAKDVSETHEMNDTLGDQCLEIINCLVEPAAASARRGGQSQSPASDDLVNEATEALQRAVTAYPLGFSRLAQFVFSQINNCLQTPGQFEKPAATIQHFGSALAYVGCSELPATPSVGLDNFILTLRSQYYELVKAVENKADFSVWCALMAAMQVTVRSFSDACKAHGELAEEAFREDEFVHLLAQYQILEPSNKELSFEENTRFHSRSDLEVTKVRSHSLLVSLWTARQLYQRIVKFNNDQFGINVELGDGKSAEDLVPFLHLLGGFAGFTLLEMTEAQQLGLKAHVFAQTLFCEQANESETSLTSAATSNVNILSMKIIEALRGPAIENLFQNQSAQQLLVNSISETTTTGPANDQVINMILTMLANRHKVERVEEIMKPLNTRAESLLASQDAALETSSSPVFAITAGLLRRFTLKKDQAEGLLRFLRECPGSPTHGRYYASRLETIVAPQKILSKDNSASVSPLWLQKLFVQIAKPMIPKALGKDAEVTDRALRTNFAIAVLVLAKHMPFAVYEEDAEDILRIAISYAQTVGTSANIVPALDVLCNILIEAPEKGEPHLNSIVTICSNVVSNRQQPRPEWLSEDYTRGDVESELVARAQREKLALEIMGGLPRMFESRHLVPLAPKVERELTLACGNGVRDLRKTARLARNAWKEMR